MPPGALDYQCRRRRSGYQGGVLIRFSIRLRMARLAGIRQVWAGCPAIDLHGGGQSDEAIPISEHAGLR